MKAQPDTISVEELLNLRRKQMLVINPEYQRGVVWTKPQKKKLVDSVLRGYPIPLIYLHHIKDQAGGLVSQRYEVIDGQQRINALWEYHEGSFKLFHPETDEAEARFPEFVKDQPCPWGGLMFRELPEDIQAQFLKTPLPIVRIETHDPNEARDLFVRLQAGMPLNSQEKRDAWPGQFTEFIQRLAGKPGIAGYEGHDLFNVLMKARMSRDRGKYRQLAAQMAILFFTRRRSSGETYCDINAAAIDAFYYENLGFDSQSPDALRFVKVLDKLTALLRDQKRSKLLGHEAIHLILLIDALVDDYAQSWEDRLGRAFDKFREDFAKAKDKRNASSPPEHWLRYGVHTRANSDRAGTIAQRHEFFTMQMWQALQPKLKDSTRLFGPVEREILYYQQRKRCALCEGEVVWADADIHHVEPHVSGGQTRIENGAMVHRNCHPKGANAARFAEIWPDRKQKLIEREE